MCASAHIRAPNGCLACSSPKRANPSAESPRAAAGIGGPNCRGDDRRGRGESDGLPSVARVRHLPAPASPSANPVGSRKRVTNEALPPLRGGGCHRAVDWPGAGRGRFEAQAQPAPPGKDSRLPAPLRPHRAQRRRHRHPRQGPPGRAPAGADPLPRPRRRLPRRRHPGQRDLLAALEAPAHRQLLGPRLRCPQPSRRRQRQRPAPPDRLPPGRRLLSTGRASTATASPAAAP